MLYQTANTKQRKRNRLQYFDYSKDGWYFVTVCIKNREEFFGRVENDDMVLNKYGKIAEGCWLEIPKHFRNVVLDEFIVMPDHIHGILVIDNTDDKTVGNNVGSVGNKNVGNKNFCSLRDVNWQTKWSRSLSSIVRGFKIGVTKLFRKNNIDDFLWQKSFYDHIIRNEESLNNIRAYIQNNPKNLKSDCINPMGNKK